MGELRGRFGHLRLSWRFSTRATSALVRGERTAVTWREFIVCLHRGHALSHDSICFATEPAPEFGITVNVSTGLYLRVQAVIPTFDRRNALSRVGWRLQQECLGLHRGHALGKFPRFIPRTRLTWFVGRSPMRAHLEVVSVTHRFSCNARSFSRVSRMSKLTWTCIWRIVPSISLVVSCCWNKVWSSVLRSAFSFCR